MVEVSERTCRNPALPVFRVEEAIRVHLTRNTLSGRSASPEASWPRTPEAVIGTLGDGARRSGSDLPMLHRTRTSVPGGWWSSNKGRPPVEATGRKY